MQYSENYFRFYRNVSPYVIVVSIFLFSHSGRFEFVYAHRGAHHSDTITMKTQEKPAEKNASAYFSI